MFRPNALTTRFTNGETSFGIWLQSGEAIFAEVVGLLRTARGL